MSDPDTLRRIAKQARRDLSDAQRERASAQIARRFLASGSFFASDVIGCYLPTHDEVDTTEVLDRAWRAAKQVAVPVVRPNRGMEFVELRRNSNLVRNAFGIWEPERGRRITPRFLDVCIVPGVAFDACGNRIGMGGGYYDRCFAFLKQARRWVRPKLIGFAFECQRVEHINTRHWDVRMHRVITERG